MINSSPKVFLSLCMLALISAGTTNAQPYDLLIQNGRIVDGSGNPWYEADIAVRGNTIVQIAPSITEPANQVIDANGLVVAPGFIDIHTHARRNIFKVPTAENYVRQGVTTLIEGQDGSSPVPLAPFLEELDVLKKSVNFGSFIGQGAIRAAVMGAEDRQPSVEEMDAMKAHVEAGMRAGAFGLSSGLFYVPGAFSDTDEVVELAAVAGTMGGIYISHMRDETSEIVESVEETIAIGERGNLPTQVTHHKVIGARNRGKSAKTLRLIDEARSRGIDASIDQYPYTASSTTIQAALLPAWAQEGGRVAILNRLQDAETRAEVKKESVRIILEERGGGDLKKVAIANCDWQPEFSGKTLEDVVVWRGLTPTVENGAETVLWIVEQGNCQGVFHAIIEEDLDRIIRHPATMIASDGGVQVFGEATPHPRSYGAFARVLSFYVRDRNTLSLEIAIQKMTSLPAQRLGIMDRGMLRPGMKADITIFDPQRVRDLATFENPHQYAEGFSYVLVNGEVVFDGKEMTEARPGQVLYGPAFQAETTH